MYVERDRRGTGVKNGGFGGSGGISGGGGDKDEELIFTYDRPVALDSILLELSDIDFGHGLNDKDDPVLFVSERGSGLFSTITEIEIRATSAASARIRSRSEAEAGTLGPSMSGQVSSF